MLAHRLTVFCLAVVVLSLGPHAGAESFTMPADGTLFVRVVNDDGGEWRFGTGGSEATFSEALRNFPSSPTGETRLGAFRSGEIVHFGVWTRFGQFSDWAFSNRSDQPSTVAFRDGLNRLGLGGNVIQMLSPTTWRLHLDNAVSYRYDDDNNDIVLDMRLAPMPTPPAGGPRFTSSGVVNAASFEPGIVPGGLISIFGQDLTTGVDGVEAAGGATSDKGTSVSIGGYSAPILVLADFSGSSQINLQAPFALTPGVPVTVQVDNNGSRFAVSGVTVYESQPGIFELTTGGARVAAVIHQIGALVRPEAPARHGEIVSVFLTGAGLIAPLVPSGSIGPVPPAVTVLPIVVGIANMGMPVVFSGYAPGFIGLYQINFQIAGATPSGSFLTFNVKVGNSFSQDSTIAVADE